MCFPVTISGLDKWKARLEGIQRRLQDAPALMEVAHQAAVDQWRQDDIPTDTGDLAESLRNPESPNHIYRQNGLSAEIGSKLRQARYQASKIRDVSATEVGAEVLEYVTGGD